MHNKKYNKTQNFIQGLRPFSNSVPRELKKMLKKGGYNFSNIIENWTKMVGKDTSEACYPCKIKTSKENMFRMRVDLPAEITKTGVERYCIIHKDIQDEVFKLVNTPTGKTKWQQHDKPNEYVFHTSTSVESGHSNEERSFTFERERMIKDGHEEMALQYMSGRHKITIHSLRSMFITLANRVSGSDLAGDFGDHMAGHSEGGMKALYDRMPENMVMEIWIKAEPLLSMENNSTEEMEVMQDEITFLKEQSEQKEKETKQMIQDMQERHIEEMAKQQVAFLEQMEKRFELKKKSK